MSLIKVDQTKLEDFRGAEIRETRNELIAQSDWRVTFALERSEPLDPNWAEYRQALRDIPQQDGFPNSIEWPEEPSES
jgi:hypothetical protein